MPPKERPKAPAYPITLAQRKNPETPVFLYVMYCKGFAKIGITENVRTRVTSMQGGNPFPIEVIYAVPLRREVAIEAEQQALLALSDVHWLSDWFKTSRSHARFVVQSIVRPQSEAAGV